MSKLSFRPRVPFTAASAIGQYVPVTLLGAASSLDDTVIRAGSVNEFPVGFTIATIATYGNPVSVLLGGIAKGIAAASLGNGAQVAVGSTNGRLIPLLASGLSTAIGSALGAAGLRFSVGFALEDAVDGGEFKVLLNPIQIV